MIFIASGLHQKYIFYVIDILIDALHDNINIWQISYTYFRILVLKINL